MTPKVMPPGHIKSHKLFETCSVQYGHRYVRFVYLGFFFYIGDLRPYHFHDPPIR